MNEDPGGRNQRVGEEEDRANSRQASAMARPDGEWYRTIVQSQTEFIDRYLPGGILTFVNDSLADYMGMAPDDLLGKSFYPFLQEDDRDEVIRQLNSLNEEHPTVVTQNRIIHPDGSVRWHRWTHRAFFDASGSVVEYQSVGRDITEHKKTEEALRLSEERLRNAQRIAKIGNWEYDPRSGSLWWSDELYRIFSLDPANGPVAMDRFLGRVFPDDRRTLEAEIASQIPCRSDYRIIAPDGRLRYIHEEIEIDRDITGAAWRLRGTAQDITERKLIESALAFAAQSGWRASEKDFFTSLVEFLAETSGADYVLLDKLADDPEVAETVAIHARGSVVPNMRYNLRGTPCENVIGKDLCIYPGGVQQLFPEDVLLVEMQVECYIGIPLWDSRGCPLGLIAVMHTQPLPNTDTIAAVLQVVAARAAAEMERRQAEEKVRQSDRLVRSITDNIEDMILLIDRDYRVLTANRAYCRWAKLPIDQVVGRHCYEVSHHLEKPCFDLGRNCSVREVYETGESRGVIFQGQGADGRPTYVEKKAFGVRDAEGSIISAIETVRDVTDRFRLDEERLKTQKLEAVGTLAGGIAHDFNNLLQGVFGYLSMAKLKIGQKEKALPLLDQAEEALATAVNLTTQLLTFSKGGKPVMRQIKLQGAIENSVRFALSGSSSNYRLEIAEDLWQVQADEGQISRVIQNIALNASEAMSGGGTVLISAGNIHLPKGAQADLPDGGRFVRIEISDAGAGIPEQHLQKIFDPYFTTKQRGSGLGLATSYSIIGHHGGTIDVRSQANLGSTFVIYLPAAEQDSHQPAPAPSDGCATGRERILVMDDEAMVSDVAREMLVELGHDVETAADGEEAVRLFRTAREEGKPFGIVLLDLTVKGGMGGEEANKQLREIDPTVITIASSGYADSPVAADHRAHGFSAFLSKPYRISTLRDCLDSFVKRA